MCNVLHNFNEKASKLLPDLYQIFHPPPLRLESHKPLWRDLQTIDVTHRWREDWQSATVVNSTLVVDPTIRLPVLIFTDVSGHCWTAFGQARATVMRARRNGVSPTTNYVTVEKSRQCHTSSTLVHWPNLPAVYCAYMKQMRLPSTGWQHMALSTR